MSPWSLGVAAITADDAQHIHLAALRFIDGGNQINADIPFPVSAANGKDH